MRAINRTTTVLDKLGWNWSISEMTDTKVGQSWSSTQTCHSGLQGEGSAQLHRWHHFDGQFGQVDCFIFLQKQREYHKEQRHTVMRKPVLNLKERSQSKLMMVLFVTTKARRWTHQIDPNLEAHGHTLNHQRDWNQSFKAKAQENWSSNQWGEWFKCHREPKNHSSCDDQLCCWFSRDQIKTSQGHVKSAAALTCRLNRPWPLQPCRWWRVEHTTAVLLSWTFRIFKWPKPTINTSHHQQQVSVSFYPKTDWNYQQIL